MKVRFLTSIASAAGSYVEGQTVPLPNPAPEPFFGWLRHGICEPVRDDRSEVALSPAAIEQAIARRALGIKSRKGRKASAVADACP